jgi:hypothetical protein
VRDNLLRKLFIFQSLGADYLFLSHLFSLAFSGETEIKIADIEKKGFAFNRKF